MDGVEFRFACPYCKREVQVVRDSKGLHHPSPCTSFTFMGTEKFLKAVYQARVAARTGSKSAAA